MLGAMMEGLRSLQGQKTNDKEAYTQRIRESGRIQEKNIHRNRQHVGIRHMELVPIFFSFGFSASRAGQVRGWKGRRREAQAGVWCEGRPKLSAGGNAPDLSAGLPFSHVNLDRGEDTPTDTEWAQRQGVDRQVEPAV